MKNKHKKAQPLRAAIYIRVSRKELRLNPTSAALQIDVCQLFAEKHGLSVEAVFKDLGQSGSDSGRQGYQELLQAVRGNEIDVLVVLAVERLTRNGDDAIVLLKLLQEANVELRSVTENITLGTAVGRLTMLMSMAFNDYYLQQRRQKARRGSAVNRGESDAKS